MFIQCSMSNICICIGLLIPEINVVRGKTYTFVVEGGHDPDVAAKYHPFYITDDPVGGYEYKNEEEKAVCGKVDANYFFYSTTTTTEFSRFSFIECSIIRRCKTESIWCISPNWYWPLV